MCMAASSVTQRVQRQPTCLAVSVVSYVERGGQATYMRSIWQDKKIPRYSVTRFLFKYNYQRLIQWLITVTINTNTLRVMTNDAMPPFSVMSLRNCCLVLNEVWVANSTAINRSTNKLISTSKNLEDPKHTFWNSNKDHLTFSAVYSCTRTKYV